MRQAVAQSLGNPRAPDRVRSICLLEAYQQTAEDDGLLERRTFAALVGLAKPQARRNFRAITFAAL